MHKQTAKKFIYFKESLPQPPGRPNNKQKAPIGIIEGATYSVLNGHLVLTHTPFEIKLGMEYKSRDGKRIVIHAINIKSQDKPVLGMICVDGCWEARYWNLKGVTKRPYGNNNDIVGEWNES